MSNYTFIAHDSTLTTAVDAWIGKHASASDVWTAPFTGDHRLVLISKEVRRSILGNTFFRGIALGEEDVAFGARGWLSAPERLRTNPGDHAGTYCVATWHADGLVVDRDVFGSARLLRTNGSGFAASSDSLLVLASLRSALGRSNTPHTEALIARTAKSAVAGQQISPETIVEEITYSPAGRGLALSRDLRWTETGKLMEARLDAGDLSYVETVRQGATNVARTVATLVSVPGWSSTLSLSGGYDSRLVLSGVLAAGARSHVGIHSVDHGGNLTADYEVAMGLVDAFGLPRTASGAPIRARRSDEFTLWGANLIGVYDGFGPARTRRWHEKVFPMTGIGAEIHKGNWDWQTLESLASVASEEGPVRDALRSQLQKAAVSVGVDPERGDASEVYYVGYRNGIHGAAGSIGLHMTTVHPVMQLELAKLGHMRDTDGTGYLGSPRGIADHTLLLSADAAAFRYDDPTRNLSRDYVEDRLSRLGGPIANVEPFTVTGHPDDIVDGPSDLSMSISRNAGLSGPITADTVLALGEDLVETITDQDVRRAFDDVLDNARWRINKANGKVRPAGISPSRAAMLAVFTV